MSRPPYIGPSEQNSQALYQREHTWSGPSAQSFRVAWDWHRREPRDLREAVRMARKAYADEVPDKLHDGPDAIGPDGTPRMAARAEGYIFGRADSDDAPKGKCGCGPSAFWQSDGFPRWKDVENAKAALLEAHRRGDQTVKIGQYTWRRLDTPVHEDDCQTLPVNQALIGYYHAPFRACLDNMAHGDASSRRRAAIVSHVTIGSQGPGEAAIAEGAHPLDAKLVAWDALCSFLRSMTDLRLHVREEAVA